MKKPSPRSLLVASLAGVLAVPLAMATFAAPPPPMRLRKSIVTA